MIRKAKFDDAEKISSLIADNHIENQQNENNGFLRYKRSPKKIKRIIDKSLVALIYVKNDQIIGFMNAYPVRKKKKKINWLVSQAKKLYYDKAQSARVYLGVIDKQHLHQGIGSKLLKELINQLDKKGYKYLFATVTTKPKANKASLQFVKKFNFHQVAETTTKPGSKTAIFIKKL